MSGCVWFVDLCFLFFFKQKTAYEMRISDWSSDVCSSDLDRAEHRILAHRGIETIDQFGDEGLVDAHGQRLGAPLLAGGDRVGVGLDRFRRHVFSTLY